MKRAFFMAVYNIAFMMCAVKLGMAIEEVVKRSCPVNRLTAGAGEIAPLIQKGNFEPRPHLSAPRSQEG